MVDINHKTKPNQTNVVRHYATITHPLINLVSSYNYLYRCQTAPFLKTKKSHPKSLKYFKYKNLIFFYSVKNLSRLEICTQVEKLVFTKKVFVSLITGSTFKGIDTLSFILQNLFHFLSLLFI